MRWWRQWWREDAAVVATAVEDFSLRPQPLSNSTWVWEIRRTRDTGIQLYAHTRDRIDCAWSHALSRRVASVARDAKFSKVKKLNQTNVRYLEK
jgi:hypothetical protein